MKIEEKLDVGPVYNYYKIEIKDNDNTETISEKLSLLAAEKIIDNIDDILEDNQEFKNKTIMKQLMHQKLKNREGKLNWNDSAENIIGKINGLYPSPGAWFMYNGERYKILKAAIGSGFGEIGEVIG